MYLLIVFLPLLSSIVAGFFVGFLLFKFVSIISCFLVSICSCVAILVFYEVALSGTCVYIKLSPWFFSEMFDACWFFYFDTIYFYMLIVVSFVSCLVDIYSISYMYHDNHLPRFMSYLSIFTFFMFMLITADNFSEMFFGSEGVGVSSYLLISFWFRLQASKASIKAMVMNRIGDFGLALDGCFFSKTVDFNVCRVVRIYINAIYFLQFKFKRFKYYLYFIVCICSW